jgi:molybdenum cofactor cytidylyltransferase
VARIEGEPLVIRPVRAALEAGLDPIVAVTGGPGTGAHEALSGLGSGEGRALRLITNPAPERGLASSLRLGVSALPAGTPAALVLLGDMLWVLPGTLRALVKAFRGPGAGPPEAACIPVHGGRRGNPVLWPAPFFPALGRLEGDQGARVLLRDTGTPVREVAVEDPGIHRDVDTEDDLAALRG